MPDPFTSVSLMYSNMGWPNRKALDAMMQGSNSFSTSEIRLKGIPVNTDVEEMSMQRNIDTIDQQREELLCTLTSIQSQH